MRSVSGNPAKRAQRSSGKQPTRKRPAFRLPGWLPKTRAGQRLTLLATWVVLTAIAVPAGWNAGRAADSQYVFIMTSIALPVGLAGLLSAWHIGLATIGGVRKIQRLNVTGWPAGPRRLAAAAVGIAGAVGVTNLIQWVHNDIPAGLIIAVILGTAAATFDVTQMVRKRRR